MPNFDNKWTVDSVALMASEEHGGQGSRALRITPPSKPATSAEMRGIQKRQQRREMMSIRCPPRSAVVVGAAVCPTNFLSEISEEKRPQNFGEDTPDG